MNKRIRRPGIEAKPFTLPNTSDFAIYGNNKHLCSAHDNYVNEVMGGLTPESLETGPVNAGFNAIKRAWSY